MKIPNKRYDLRRFNLGFSLGINVAMTNLETQTPFKDPDVNLELKSVDAHGQAGINLGLITNLNLHNNIDVRFVPAVSLQQRNFDLYLVMKNGKDSIAKRQLEAAYLELPFYVKFKSNYYRNMRVYYGQGIKYSLNLASDRKVRNDPNVLKINSQDIALEFAFGIDLYGDKLKLTPELRYSMGLPDIFVRKNTYFSGGISGMRNQMLLISLNFE